MKLDKTAIQSVFKHHPKSDSVVVAQDGTIFFTENDARNHSDRFKFSESPVTITRGEAEAWVETPAQHQVTKEKIAVESKLTEGEVSTAAGAADAIARISELDTPEDIAAYVKGENRVTVIEAAEAQVASLKK